MDVQLGVKYHRKLSLCWHLTLLKPAEHFEYAKFYHKFEKTSRFDRISCQYSSLKAEDDSNQRACPIVDSLWVNSQQSVFHSRLGIYNKKRVSWGRYHIEGHYWENEDKSGRGRWLWYALARHRLWNFTFDHRHVPCCVSELQKPVRRLYAK